MAELFQVAVANGLHPRITSTDRSYAAQARLYRLYLARGRTGLPAAPPGSSKHEQGRAFDMVISDSRYYEPLARLWESWGGRAGYRFNDPVHFEA